MLSVYNQSINQRYARFNCTTCTMYKSHIALHPTFYFYLFFIFIFTFSSGSISFHFMSSPSVSYRSPLWLGSSIVPVSLAPVHQNPVAPAWVRSPGISNILRMGSALAPPILRDGRAPPAHLVT